MTPRHHPPMPALICALLVSGLGACTDAEDEPQCVPRADPTSLIDQSAWQYVEDPSQDPVPAHRPAEVVCPEFARDLEGSILEVDTGACNYLTISQPTVAPIQACDTVQVTISHFNLYAPEPAEAHVAVFLDGDAVVDEVRAIPGPSGFIYVRWKAQRAYELGAPVAFHIHNHGVNQWQFVDMSVGDE